MIKENFQETKTHLRENYGPTETGYGPTLGAVVPNKNAMINMEGVPIPTGQSGSYGVQIETNPFTSCRFCNDDISLEKCVFNNPNYESLNQKLAGGPNPKTLVMPIIAPPIADSEFWKPNDFVFPRAINSESNVELYQSGYVVQDKKCLPSKEAINKLAPRNIEVCECKNGSEKGGISVPESVPVYNFLIGRIN